MKNIILSSIIIGMMCFVIAYIDYGLHGESMLNDGTMRYHYTHMSWLGQTFTGLFMICFVAPFVVWGWRKIVK